MAILPEEVETKEFIVALRGYDKDEVHDFLKDVAEELRVLRSGRDTGEAEDPIRKLGDHVTEVIRNADDVARRLREGAKSESDEVIRRAKDESAALRDEAINIREAAERAAAEIRESAERDAAQFWEAANEYATEVRAKANREADELRETAKREVDALREAASRETDELLEAALREADELRGKAAKVWGDADLSGDGPDANGNAATGQDGRIRAAHDRLAELHAELDQLATACRDLVEVLRAGSSDPSPPAARPL